MNKTKIKELLKKEEEFHQRLGDELLSSNKSLAFFEVSMAQAFEGAQVLIDKLSKLDCDISEKFEELADMTKKNRDANPFNSPSWNYHHAGYIAYIEAAIIVRSYGE